jgi:hypothetical protein
MSQSIFAPKATSAGSFVPLAAIGFRLHEVDGYCCLARAIVVFALAKFGF